MKGGVNVYEATVSDFKVGDLVSISDFGYFGRHGTVVKVGRKYVTVKLHIYGNTVKFRPVYLRVVDA